MRKFLIPLLAASALVPATASAQDGGFDRGIRAQGERASQRDSASEDRTQRSTSSEDRPQRAQRTERPTANEEPRARVERAERPDGVERNFRRAQTSEPEPQPARRMERTQTEIPAERVRRIETNDDDGIVRGIQRMGRDAQARQQEEGVQVHRDRDGFDGLRDRIAQNGDRDDNHRRWRTDWRKDNRYNWYSYRNRYGSLYRLGRYYDPYGWGYRRWSIGFNLWPSYYGSNYWLNDPWMYRLPPAYGSYRWVRYWDDALLVNIYTGQVVDVINNFFW